MYHHVCTSMRFDSHGTACRVVFVFEKLLLSLSLFFFLEVLQKGGVWPRSVHHATDKRLLFLCSEGSCCFASSLLFQQSQTPTKQTAAPRMYVCDPEHSATHRTTASRTRRPKRLHPLSLLRVLC